MLVLLLLVTLTGRPQVYYFPSNDVVALVENCSPFLKIYNTNCEQILSIKTPDGFVQCAEHLPKVTTTMPTPIARGLTASLSPLTV